MNISFITTVFNENDSITAFLESINKQTMLPDEIIFVDGGSSDGTVARIKNYESRIKEKGIEFKLIIKKGNIASGRNEAIKNTKNEVILISDVGCVLRKDWVKNISKPFEDKKVDVVAGYYKSIANTVFEKCLAAYTCVMPDKINENDFLPSSRSIAFKKSAWKTVGGYPQWLDTCEDLFFARELKKKGFKFKFVKDALVYWPQRENLHQAFMQFYNYAKGDGMAFYIRPNTPFLFLRYIIGLSLIIIIFKEKSIFGFLVLCLMFILYCFWSILKNYKYVNNVKALLYLPILQFTSDVAVLTGMTVGIIQRFSINKKSN
jgi:glycosyltransferase involved in cell wall biosynthesis